MQESLLEILRTSHSFAAPERGVRAAATLFALLYRLAVDLAGRRSRDVGGGISATRVFPFSAHRDAGSCRYRRRRQDAARQFRRLQRP